MERKHMNPSIFETNIFYLIIGVLLLFLGGLVQSKEIYLGLIITEYLIILLPTITYLKARGYSLKKVLKLNKISAKEVALIFLIVIFSYPVGVFLNYLMILLLSNFTELKPTPIPIPKSTWEYFLGLLVISLSPGICEEVLFRGMVMSSYEKLGKKKAIIISAILFGIFHFNLQNLVGPIFLGIIFGFIAYKTNSLFSTMIAHGVNNSIATTIAYLTMRNMDKISIESQDIGISMGSFATVLTIIVGFVIAIISGAIAYTLYKSLPDNSYEEDISFEEYTPRVVHYLPLLVVLVIFIIYNYMVLFVY
ncbi:MAG: CPBP family intramembrane metalloprotease [Sporanaerobacter sp.]|uniref:CPBP family glutamic-type intramembrane protease n=1 Tax=Sporanaerobacter sp. TaxID=2010183 RepID=UPI003A0FF223